jgi:hypothetical protein
MRRIFRHQAILPPADIAPLFELHEEIIIKFPLTYGDKLLLSSKQVNGVNKVFKGEKNSALFICRNSSAL